MKIYTGDGKHNFWLYHHYHAHISIYICFDKYMFLIYRYKFYFLDNEDEQQDEHHTLVPATSSDGDNHRDLRKWKVLILAAVF